MISNSKLIGSLESVLLSKELNFTKSQYLVAIKLIAYFVKEGNTKDQIVFSLSTSISKLAETMGCSKNFMQYTLKDLKEIGLFLQEDQDVYQCDLNLIGLKKEDF